MYTMALFVIIVLFAVLSDVEGFNENTSNLTNGGTTTTVRMSITESVRLVNTYNDWEGIIEIYDDKEQKWGALCGYDMDSLNAKVICRQLLWDGYREFYKDAYTDKFNSYGYYENSYGGYVYSGLDCYGGESDLSQCDFDERRGDSNDCFLKERQFAGVTCNNGKGTESFSIEFNYFGWLLMMFLMIVVFVIVRRYHQRRRLRHRHPNGMVVGVTVPGAAGTNQPVGVAVPPPTNSTYPPPPPGTYPTQVPSDMPPQYNAVVPPAQNGQAAYPPPGGAPYPPQGGAPYPPQGGAPYPPQGGAPYPPQGGTPYPVAPPPNDAAKYPPPPPGSYPTQQPGAANPGYPPASNPAYAPPGGYNLNDAVPAMPPPSYDSIASAPADSGGGGGSSA